MPLNPQQQTAAQAPATAPLKIIAGAGTGKTETLAARYVELVRAGIVPDRIALLTFTEDAAAEMRARVALRLQEAGLQLPPHALLDPWIGTFHGFAMRLLREHGFAIGLPPAPRLLADDEQDDLWQEIVARMEDALHLPEGYAPLDHSAYRWDSDETWNRVRAVFDALRRGGATPAELRPHDQLAATQHTRFAEHRAQLVPLIRYCWSAYTSYLHSTGTVDYDELISAATRLLELMPSLRERFDAVLVDEFQDTNRPQLALLAALQPGFAHTTVVGDPRQAIYGWNSARAETIYRFPFADSGKMEALTVNYRSHPAIMHVANLALHSSELGDLPVLQPPAEKPAANIPVLRSEPVVSLHVVPSVENEARLVAAEVQRLHSLGVPYGDMAVLVRARTHLAVLRTALQEAHVPFITNGGTGFYDHWAVRLTSSLLRLLDDPTDQAAAVHVLDSALIGVPLDALADQVAWQAWPFAAPTTVMLADDVVQQLDRFGTFWTTAVARWGLLHPSVYLDWLWQACGLHGLVASDPQASLVLRQLLRDAEDVERRRSADGIAGFSAWLQQRILERPRVPLPSLPSGDALEVATVHQAKGREWPVVFVINTSLPSQRAGQVERVLWDEHWKLVISDDTKPKKGEVDPLHELRRDLRRRQRNEERAIWYVALTRAQSRLYVAHSGCALEDGGFADARGKLQRIARSEPPFPDDEAVHFFHELWELLPAQAHQVDVEHWIKPMSIPPCL
jgi:DNA helicase-2/ATP-dependent DNA helicase PcrA